MSNINSLHSFKKIIQSSTLQPKSDKTLQFCPEGGQLLIESRLHEDQCILGLESQKSKLQDKAVKSSIDSDKKPKSTNNSIPLSQLILRDNGYDYLFTSPAQHKKLQRKYHQNVKELKKQTLEMIDTIHFQLLVLEIQEIKQKIQNIEKQVSKIRNDRKSKEPVQQYSDYLYYIGSKRKERKSGKFISKQMRYSRSNMRTQCDSKAPSLASTPLTPIHQRKSFTPTKPPKTTKQQYHSLLTSKKQLLKTSINTIKTFNEKRTQQLNSQINLMYKQIILIDSQLLPTPVRKNIFRSTVGHPDTSTSRNKSQSKNRKIMCFYSPRNVRQSRKGQLLSRAKRQFGSPRAQYFISN